MKKYEIKFIFSSDLKFVSNIFHFPVVLYSDIRKAGSKVSSR